MGRLHCVAFRREAVAAWRRGQPQGPYHKRLAVIEGHLEAVVGFEAHREPLTSLRGARAPLGNEVGGELLLFLSAPQPGQPISSGAQGKVTLVERHPRASQFLSALPGDAL